jgi:hypothetical protein
VVNFSGKEYRLSADVRVTEACQVTVVSSGDAAQRTNSIRPSTAPYTGRLDEWNLSPGFRPVDIGKLLQEEDAEVPWIVEGYLAEGGFTVLAGAPKLGKTTLAYECVVAVAAGNPFLDRATVHGKVLILAVEEHRRDVALRLRGRVVMS